MKIGDVVLLVNDEIKPLNKGGVGVITMIEDSRCEVGGDVFYLVDFCIKRCSWNLPHYWTRRDDMIEVDYENW